MTCGAFLASHKQYSQSLICVWVMFLIFLKSLSWSPPAGFLALPWPTSYGSTSGMHDAVRTRCSNAWIELVRLTTYKVCSRSMLASRCQIKRSYNRAKHFIEERRFTHGDSTVAICRHNNI